MLVKLYFSLNCIPLDPDPRTQMNPEHTGSISRSTTLAKCGLAIHRLYYCNIIVFRWKSTAPSCSVTCGKGSAYTTRTSSPHSSRNVTWLIIYKDNTMSYRDMYYFPFCLFRFLVKIRHMDIWVNSIMMEIWIHAPKVILKQPEVFLRCYCMSRK